MNSLDKKIGKKIKQARLEKKMTQKQVATLMHTCQPEINKIELGKRTISAEHLVKFSELLNREVLFFLSDLNSK